MNNFRSYRFVLLSFFICLSHNAMSMKRQLSAEHSTQTTSKTVRLYARDEGIKLSAPGLFFHELDPNVVSAIVAQVKNRNAVRKTCRLFAALASINNLIPLCLNSHFQGSYSDYAKAYEHCIEADDHTSLQAIVTKREYKDSHLVNEIGYSLEEYASALNRETCFAILRKNKNPEISPSLKRRVNDRGWYVGNQRMVSTGDDVIMGLATEQLLHALYKHKVTKNDTIVQYLLEQKKLAELSLHSTTHTGFIDTFDSHQQLHRYLELSPLSIAAYNNDIPLMQLLLSKSDKIDDTEDAALNIACIRGFPQVVELLLNAGCNPNALLAIDKDKGDNPHKTALCNAAQCGSTECVRALLNSDKLTNKKEQYQTALLYATESGCSELVELLLSFKIKPNIENDIILNRFAKDDTTRISEDYLEINFQPIDVATYYGDFHIVQQLIAAGTAITEQTITLAQEESTQEILGLLLHARSKIDSNEVPPTQP